MARLEAWSTRITSHLVRHAPLEIFLCHLNLTLFALSLASIVSHIYGINATTYPYNVGKIGQTGYYGIDSELVSYADGDPVASFNSQADSYPIYDISGPYSVSSDKQTMTVQSYNYCIGTVVFKRV